MVASFSKWLHEGEQDAIGLYRRPWIAITTCSAAGTLFVALLFGAVSAGLGNVSAVLLLPAFGILSWRRQAAILTPSELLLRPLLGKPRRLFLQGVKRVSRIERPSGEGGWMEICRLEFFRVGYLFSLVLTGLPGAWAVAVWLETVVTGHKLSS